VQRGGAAQREEREAAQMQAALTPVPQDQGRIVATAPVRTAATPSAAERLPAKAR
jgi:hypothetical protein